MTTPDPAAVAAVRAALAAADYTVEGVAALLGPVAHAAMNRGETVPALGVTAGDDGRLATLVRLFLLGEPVRLAAAAAALPGPAAAELGLVDAGADGVRALLDVRPHADDVGGWWVVSDLGSGPARPGPVAPDHVLGIGGASVSLADATLRLPSARALDLGTGCGIQALHLSRHADRIVGTDRNPRALRLAALTMALNGLEPRVELLEGDLFAPVTGRRFDLIVSNPPFVVSPGGSDLLYRDSGLAGDAVAERIVRTAPTHLVPGGTAQLLANWMHVAGTDWRERVAAWVPAGVDAWFLQREVQDPADYVETWLRDSGEAGTPGYAATYDAWLRWFDDVDVTGIGFGHVLLRASGSATPWLVTEELTQQTDHPLAPALGAQVARLDWLRGRDDAALLAHAFLVAPSLRLEQQAQVGEDGWEVVDQALHLLDGLRRRAGTDAVGAALVAGCDGATPLGTVVAVLAATSGMTAHELTAPVCGAVRRMVEDGFLVPEGP
jgi:predicted RNA methylase